MAHLVHRFALLRYTCTGWALITDEAPDCGNLVMFISLFIPRAYCGRGVENARVYTYPRVRILNAIAVLIYKDASRIYARH